MKKFIKFLTCFLLLLILGMPNMLNAQTAPCGFDAATEAQLQQNPLYINILNQIEQSYGLGDGPADGYYIIPTVVHIIHNNGVENISDSQVLDAIQQANNQLAGSEGGFDTKIQLSLARRDPLGNCTNGIVRVQYPFPDADASSLTTDITIKNLSRWDPNRYLNI